MREGLMMKVIKTKGPFQTMAVMVTSPSYTLIRRHKMGKETFIKTSLMLYKRLVKTVFKGDF